MTDIYVYTSFAEMEPIKNGWSGDKKYYMECKDMNVYELTPAGISVMILTMPKAGFCVEN
jgi:hypothetical protein